MAEYFYSYVEQGANEDIIRNEGGEYQSHQLPFGADTENWKVKGM